MKQLGWLFIFIGVLAACNNRPTEPPPPTTGEPPMPDSGAAEIRSTGELLPAGYMASLLGVSIREPLQPDKSGKQLQASSQGPAFDALPITAIRQPAGSVAYKMVSTADANTQYTLTVLLPALPNVAHDFTWPPQLPPDELPEWLTPQTRTISLANEPPIHPEHFATGEAYVAWARSIVDAYPALWDAFALQSGKPHIADLSPDQKQRQKHEQFLQATGAAVRNGILPARIYNTTKLYPEFPADLYAFFTTEQNRYAETHTENVQVTYGEWNWAEADNLTPEQIPACAAFLLVLSRLRAERGDQVFAANYQQGYAVGTSNIIGLDGPAKKGNWVQSSFTEFWNQFGQYLRDGQYMRSTISRPANTYLELFVLADGTPIVLYANRDTVAVPCTLPATTITYYTNTNPALTGPWQNSLPPLSAGSIPLTALP